MIVHPPDSEAVQRHAEPMTISEVLKSHGVTVDRLEPISTAWLPLLDELLARLVASGWRHRRIAQLKEKFGTLRLHLERDGESEEFLEWARVLTAVFRERSAR